MPNPSLKAVHEIRGKVVTSGVREREREKEERNQKKEKEEMDLKKRFLYTACSISSLDSLCKTDLSCCINLNIE